MIQRDRLPVWHEIIYVWYQTRNVRGCSDKNFQRYLKSEVRPYDTGTLFWWTNLNQSNGWQPRPGRSRNPVGQPDFFPQKTRIWREFLIMKPELWIYHQLVQTDLKNTSRDKAIDTNKWIMNRHGKTTALEATKKMRVICLQMIERNGIPQGPFRGVPRRPRRH